MDIRQLQYLAALARERHFTRAARACNVTQPTLSGRIRQLEQELGVPIVERGQRFHGLTPEGEKGLKWAHAILDNWGSLQQEIAKLRNTKGTLIGRLSLGVIPSGLPMAALLAKAIQERHPGIEQVLYPGLPSHPQHALAKRQMQGGFGGMLSIRVKGGEAAAVRCAARVKLWKRATSLGGVESLVEHRASIEGPTTPVPRDLLRLSAGIESAEELLSDLGQALA